MNAEHRIVVNAPLEKTYHSAESYPLFVDSFLDKKILMTNDDGSKVRITNLFFNLPLTWEGQSKKQKNKSISWIQTSGLLKGLTAEWLFVPITQESTEVIIKGKYLGSGFPGFFLSSVAPILISKAAKKILESLKSVSEC